MRRSQKHTVSGGAQSPLLARGGRRVGVGQDSRGGRSSQSDCIKGASETQVRIGKRKILKGLCFWNNGRVKYRALLEDLVTGRVQSEGVVLCASEGSVFVNLYGFTYVRQAE